MFKLKLLADKPDRIYGLCVRFFGIDFSLVALGWINEWRVVELRIPCNYGIYFQIGFLLLSIGRLPDDSIYAS